MNDNASHKDGGKEEIPKITSEAPGIPAGEEIPIDPVGGDEIDPIDRWWDDADSEDREKIRNRRVEEGEIHRVKSPPPVVPEISAVKEESSPPPSLEKADLVPVSAEADEDPAPEEEGEESALPENEDLTEKSEESDEPGEFLESLPAPVERDSAGNRQSKERENDDLEMPTFTVSPLKRGHRPETPPLELTEVLPGIGETAAAKDEMPEAAKRDFVDEIDLIGDSKKPDEKEETAGGDAFEGLDGILGGQDESALPVTVTPPKKKAGCWTVFATLFFVGSIIVFLGIAAVAVFAWSKAGDFGNEATALAVGKLEEKGIYLDFGTWSYEFPRGLVFNEVTVFDDSSKERPVLKTSGIGVNIDVLGLVKGGGSPGSAEISLKNSTLTLYEGENLFSEISGIDGEILASTETVEVERLTAVVGGLLVDLTGKVTLTESGATPEATESGIAETAAPAEPERLTLDFTPFRQLQPWLAIKASGDALPVLKVKFAMDSASPDLVELNGNLSGSEVEWQNVKLKSIVAAFTIVPETGVLGFPSVQLGYGDGIIAASLAVDTSANLLRIEKFQSTVDIVSLLKAYQPEYAAKLEALRFVDPPTIQISGEIPLADPTQAELEIRYEHGQGLVYVSGERELPLKDIRGTFKLSRGSLETNNAAADLFGGAVIVNGATRLTSESNPFNGLVEISRMPLDKAAVYFGQDKVGMSGFLSLDFRGVGYKDVSRIRGGGNLRIDEASLPSFPVLGPVQKLIGGIVPAFGAKEKGSVTGAYIIESGVLLTNDFTIENGGARIVTGGSLNLSTKETQFASRAVLEPSLAAATGLADKAIVVEGSGPVTAPVLKVSEFPIEFASAALGTVLGTSKESLGSLKDALAGAEDPAAVISGKIEEATGVEIDPEITDLLKSFLSGGGGPKPAVAVPVEQ